MNTLTSFRAKQWLFSTLLLCAVAFAGCSKSASVSITVTQNGTVQAGTTVYMFTDDKRPGTLLFQPIHANKQIVTNASGTAVFDIERSLFHGRQQTFYFGVFAADGTVNNTTLGYVGVTAKRGESESGSLQISNTTMTRVGS